MDIRLNKIENFDEAIKKNYLSVIVSFMLILVILNMPSIAYADSDLYQFFEETQGQTYIAYRYFSFVFKLTQLIVTLAGLLILCFKVATMASSFLVTVNPPLFSMIHSKKTKLISKYSDKKNSEEGITKDLFFYYLSFAIPDFLYFSDFSDTLDEGESGKYGEKKWDHIPTIGEYFKKEVVSFVVVTLLGAMLFSGQTQRIVANFAKGGQALASKIENLNIAGMVDSAMNAGKDFKFVFGNSIEGKNKKRLADAMYSSAKSAVPDARDSEYLATLGSKIQSVVNTYMSDIQDGYANPTLSFKTTFVENATNVASKDASDDGYGGLYGVKVVYLKNISSIPKNPPAYYNTGAIVIEYTAQKASTQSQINN